MSPCFGDTSFFLAALIPDDVCHASARRWAEANRDTIVTTEYVLVEVGNYLSPPPTRRLFGAFLQSLTSDPRLELVAASTALLERGATLYGSRGDKGWSLTDCISFVLMRERGLTKALTADRHFEQAGFVALLKPGA